jgi:hypothetical protein
VLTQPKTDQKGELQNTHNVVAFWWTNVGPVMRITRLEAETSLRVLFV